MRKTTMTLATAVLTAGLLVRSAPARVPVAAKVDVNRPTLAVVTNGDEIVFGDMRLAVSLDRATLAVRSFAVGGKTVLESDPDHPATLVPNRMDGSALTNAVLRGLGLSRTDANTVRIANRCGDWRIDTELRLDAERRRVRRRYDVAWLGRKPGVLTSLWVNHGTLRRGGYLLPRLFPPVERTAADCRAAHGVVTVNNVSPTVAVADDGKGTGLFVCTDETRPYSDRVNALVREQDGGFSLSTAILASGYVTRGTPQTLGDVWLQFVPGGRAEALDAVRRFFADLGLKAPADRPDWVRHLVLYSTHPTGPVEYGRFGRTGLAGRAKFLPEHAALGVNCLWLQPLTDRPDGDVGNYNPRDYYKLMPEAGTPDDLRRYVASAHGLGLRVWHDAVVHGGRSDTPRAIAHPEWVGWRRDGSKLPYWCFDQNWPSWADYIGRYVETWTRDYGLDGWREDVPTGSRHPNWNPQIPYARASYAQNQGGFLMQRTVRAAARRANPGAATLAETHLGFYATASDAIYDVKLCHEVFPELRNLPPEEGVRLLQRRLAEHRAVSVPGTVWMRYVESHDSLRAASAYGRAGTDALMALCAWTDGFPLVLEGGELAAFETWRDIFRIRRETPALASLAADFTAPSAPPGVFACLRGEGADAVVVLVNFLGRRVRGTVRGGGCDFTCDLAPLGYGVFARNGAPVPAAATSVSPFEGIAADARATADFTVETNAAHEIVIRLPKATRWFAEAADGSSGGPVNDHYPDWSPTNVPKHRVYHDRQNATCRWRSAFHPFGFTRAHATVGGIWKGGAVEISGFRPTDDARICERTDGGYGLAVVVPVGCPVDVRSVPSHRSSVAGTGDARLTPLVGGWRLETGTVRVDVSTSGALREAARREKDGWRTLAVRGGFVLDTKRKKHRFLDQFAEVEAHQYFEQHPDGRLALTFEGELRDLSRGDGLLMKPVRFRTALVAAADGAVTYETTFAVSRSYRSREAEIIWQAERLDASLDRDWIGARPPRSVEKAKFSWFGSRPFHAESTKSPLGLKLSLHR